MKRNFKVAIFQRECLKFCYSGFYAFVFFNLHGYAALLQKFINDAGQKNKMQFI